MQVGTKISIQPLLDVLKEYGTPYALLGDPVAVLESERDNDYDLVVPRDRLSEDKKWLQSYCSRTGIKMVQCLQHEVTGFYYVLGDLNSYPPQYIKIDFCSDYVRNGRLLMSADELLDSTEENEDGVRIPAPARAFIYYLLKKIDKRQPISGFDYMRRVYRADPAGAQVELSRFFPKAESELITRAFEQDTKQILHTNQSALRRCLPRTIQSPIFFMRNEWPRVIRRIRYRTGVMIAVLGSDGSGKSTVIKDLQQRVRPLFRRTECYHLRPTLICTKRDGTPVVDPHGQPKRSAFMSWVKSLYWWVEYTGGYVLRIWPALIRSTVVIFDRYVDDLGVDPKRYRWGGGERLAQWLKRAVPQPELIFILDAPPDVLLARKQEVSYAELERQRLAYRQLAEQPDYHLIDAARPVSDIARDMELHIATFMHPRLMKRSLKNRHYAQ